VAEHPLNEVFGPGEPDEPEEPAGALGAFVGADPFAATVAMAQADANPGVARDVSAYLRDLSRLARVQFEHLHEQRVLNVGHLRVRLWRERFQLAFQAFLALAASVVAVLAINMLLDAFASRRVIVEAFDTPPALAARGLSPKAVAGDVLDGLTRLQAATRATDQKRDLANAWDQDVKIEVPDTGVSVGEIDRLLHARFGHDVHIGGDVTLAADGQLSLRIRGDGIVAKTFTGAPEDIDKLATAAAEYVYGNAEPYLFGVYLNQSGRAADAESFLATAYPTASTLVRSNLANLWGNALESQGRYAEATAKYRLAIHLNPRSWSAWTNLVGALLFTDGEEAAYRTGERMRVVAAAAPKSQRPTPDSWQNLDFLPQDWSAELADIEFDARKMAGQGTSDVIAGQSLADTAVRLHDFDAAARYLLTSDPKDPNIRAERLFVDGYHALEAGSPARAVAPLEALDAILRGDTGMQESFADDSCYLGLAYGLTGQGAKAEALFARRGRWVACYSFHADALDHSGDWPGAQAGYARAVALAPDLPFAYDRWGQALLRHGDAAGAAAKFAAAHQRGPHWADPLKHWGDALASLGQRREAAVKYAQAATYAPNWAELRLARSRAG
jgi:tetratricopeptide (TPR) repeat protein